MVQYSIVVAVQYNVVQWLQRAVVGSDSVGASFPKSNPHFNLQTRIAIHY